MIHCIGMQFVNKSIPYHTLSQKKTKNIQPSQQQPHWQKQQISQQKDNIFRNIFSINKYRRICGSCSGK